MIEQSILDIRKDEYTKGLRNFIAKYVSIEDQVEATLEMARLMSLHFNWTLDQYDLDRKNDNGNNK